MNALQHPVTPESTLLNWCVYNAQSNTFTYRPNRSSAIMAGKHLCKQGFSISIQEKIGGDWTTDNAATLAAYQKSQEGNVKASHKPIFTRLNAAVIAMRRQSSFTEDQIQSFMSCIIDTLEAIDVSPDEFIQKWIEREQS